MKKIVLAIPSLECGGAEKFVRDLATKLDRKKFDFCIAVTRTWRDNEYLTDMQAKGIRVVDLSGANYFKMLRKQVDFLHEFKPDVVHANTGSVLHLMIACALYHVPKRIYTFHNEAKLLYNSIFKKMQYEIAFYVFGFVPIAICPAVKRTILQEFRFSDNAVPCVNNGVDIEQYIPNPHPVQNDIRIISTGTVYWIKNHVAIINAVKNIYKDHPTLHLTILGDGEDRKKLLEQIHKDHLEEVVSMPGRSSNIVEELNKADIYVSASHTEGLPLSILEAMACGLPVVATNVGGTADIIQDGINGFLTKKDSDNDLETAMRKMIECSDEKKKSLSIAARKTAVEWSLDRCVEGYENLYNER